MRSRRWLLPLLLSLPLAAIVLHLGACLPVGAGDPETSRVDQRLAGAWTEIREDGTEGDVVVLDHSTGLQFFENRSGSGAGRRFLDVRLVGRAPNTDAIGARVFVTADLGNGHGLRTQLRLAEANSNFNSQNTPDLHFGLGHAVRADTVRVVWPGGAELACAAVAANRFVVLDERLGDAGCPAP